MARSKFGENQIRDEVVLTEGEHDTRDHSTVSSGIPSTLLELTDTPESYDDGKYLKSTTTGTEWGGIPQSGLGTVKHYQFDFYNDESHPHAIVEGAVYSVLTTRIILGANSKPVDTIKLEMTGESDKSDCNGIMQIYDLTNNNEISEFTCEGLRDPTWEVITVSGMNNLPAEEAVFELRTKSTNVRKSNITHMFIY